MMYANHRIIQSYELFTTMLVQSMQE